MSHAGRPTPLFAALLSAGLLWSVPEVAAQVYRCEQGGTVRYSDKPCASGAQPVELPKPIVVPAGPKADLLGEAERRRNQQRQARDTADAQWLQDHETRKSEEDRLRDGRVSRTVVQGMRPADVRRIHGEPSVVSAGKTAKGARETWSYAMEGGRRVHVTFIDGVVTNVREREEQR